MIKTLGIDEFLNLKNVPLIDVRTPAEFIQGHIPAAYNIPLFSNEERVLVGTTYKQKGREEAILLGFDLTGAKWSGFIKEALTISTEKKVRVHCWRGGMRSGAMAWALNLYGFEVYLLEGGYKKYRRWALDQFDKKYNMMILGGMTGSAKTQTLQEMARLGQQFIDLECLAQHQGSSYGSMNKLVQPTQEQFENDLAIQLSGLDKEKFLWLEDESLTIGKRSIPTGIWKQMRDAQVVFLSLPLEERIDFLLKEYGTLDKNFLSECTLRIAKRLGPEQTKHAVAAIHENRMADFIRWVLVYYDKTYQGGLNKREPLTVHKLECSAVDPAGNAIQILKYSGTLAAMPLEN